MKLGLENVRTLLAALGDPQNNYKKVQVAGTNGKGSVCAFLDSICREAGIKPGLYTSPHLVSITERIKIDGEDIAADEFARIATRIRETAERLLADGKLAYLPTYFEQVTTIGLLAFADAKVEFAILETGLGGRLDATTAANAEIAVITRIDLDHQEYLGNTIEEIAMEKAAIIRPGSVVCVGRQQAEADAVIAQRCAEFGIKPYTLGSASWKRNYPGFDFAVEGFEAEEVELALKGEHQAENAALAIVVAVRLKQFFDISKENMIIGLETAVHPGRLELVGDERPWILLDGAHNIGGAKALARYLEDRYQEASIALVYGSMKGKDFGSIFEVLCPFVTDVILTEPDNTRSMSATEIADAVRQKPAPQKIYVIPKVKQALDSAIELASTYPETKPSLVLVTGSLYLVGDVRKILKGKFEI